MHQPDFEKASTAVGLENCDREPIHTPGRIQSFGALIAMTPDRIIRHASANLAKMLGLPAGDVIGTSLATLIDAASLAELMEISGLAGSGNTVERVFGLALRDGGPKFDVAIHSSGRFTIWEFEHHNAAEREQLDRHVRPLISRLAGADSIGALCKTVARQIRQLTGMQRVMVYRFEADEGGTVIAEAKETGLQPYLGLRYPAGDIPKQARALYLRNTLRLIADVDDPCASILPAAGPDAPPLDLSMSTTRAVSPVHLEYLRNMGVAASMSISIIVEGRLWGLIACHHNSPRRQSYALRTAAELYGVLFSYTLEQMLYRQEREDSMLAQALHDEIMAELADDASVLTQFETIVSSIRHLIPHDGAIGWVDGAFRAQGHVPDRDVFQAMLPFLVDFSSGTVYATENIQEQIPDIMADFADFSGALVLPVSRKPGDVIVLFRRELVQSVRWAGVPEKTLTASVYGPRLTPRKSFEEWQQTVRNQSAPWTATQIRLAQALRVTLLEVVLRMSDRVLAERVRAQDHQELLIAELNHRVRNILNLIKGVVKQSSHTATTIKDLTSVIGGRIHALALAHDQLTQVNWTPVSLKVLIGKEAAAYVEDGLSRLEVSGPDVFLVPRAYSALALVLHEMMTNAVKYGALSSTAGRVHLDISQRPDGRLGIDWRERGGPAVQVQNRRGFGTTIIEHSIPHELQGEVDMRFRMTGVEASFILPASEVDRFADLPVAAAVQAEDAPATQPAGRAVPQRALIVEDNIIIGLDAQTMLEDAGVGDIVLVATVSAALQEIDRHKFDFALLDINLGLETCFPVADRLMAEGIPFSFASGYGDLAGMDAKFAAVPVIAKPFDLPDLQAVFAGLTAVTEG